MLSFQSVIGEEDLQAAIAAGVAHAVDKGDTADSIDQYMERMKMALALNKQPTTVTTDSYCCEPAELEMLMDIFLYKDPKFVRRVKSACSSTSSSPTK
jgi:hypothetical protein